MERRASGKRQAAFIVLVGLALVRGGARRFDGAGSEGESAGERTSAEKSATIHGRGMSAVRAQPERIAASCPAVSTDSCSFSKVASK